MNKRQLRSIHCIQTTTGVIKQLAEYEMQHGIKQKRKHAIESLYGSLVLHAHKLGLDVPRLGTFYKPDEYVTHCDSIMAQIEQKYGTEVLASQNTNKE